MERIVKHSYGHKNGPKSGEKVSRVKSHGQIKKPYTGCIQGKKDTKKKPPEKSDGLIDYHFRKYKHQGRAPPAQRYKR